MLLNEPQRLETVSKSFTDQLILTKLRSIMTSVRTYLVADGARQAAMSFADKACEIQSPATFEGYDSIGGSLITMLAPMDSWKGHMLMVHPMSIKIDFARFPALFTSLGKESRQAVAVRVGMEQTSLSRRL